MDLSAIALQGLNQAEVQLEKAATKVASLGSDSPDGVGMDVVDLSTEMVALLSAQNLFAANLATLRVADNIPKSLLDVIA